MLLHSRATVMTWASVVRPSVRPYTSFSRKPWSRLTPNVYHISRPFLFVFQIFFFIIIFLRFLFFVFVNISTIIYGSKNFKRLLPKNHAYFRGGSLLKLFKELWNLKFWILNKYFSFSLTWDHMGVKVSNDISPERTHQICSRKFMDTPREGLYQSRSKNS